MLSVLKELVLEVDRVIQNPNKQTVIVNQGRRDGEAGNLARDFDRLRGGQYWEVVIQ